MASAAHAQSRFGDIVVSHDRDQNTTTTHGYVEYRFTVTNQSADTGHRVTLEIPHPDYRYTPYGHSLRSLSRTVELDPGATTRLSLYQPDLTLSGSQAGVLIDGRSRHDWMLPVQYASNRGSHIARYFGRSPSSPRPQILQSPGTGQDIFAHANRAGILGTPPTAVANAQWVRPDVPVALWSPQWLAYSSFDGLVVSAEDWKKMPPDVQSALERYVECGGNLLVLGPVAVPDSWVRRATTFNGLITYHAGFGQCQVCDDPRYQNWTGKRWQQAARPWFNASFPGEKIKSAAEANRMFPVVEDLGVPVRGLFVTMVLFALAIGPVNLFVLNRKGRKIWLLWTVPLISLLTSAGVFGYMFVSEGWHGHARTDGLTILDEAAHRATTIGWAAFYTPLTPPDGLHYDYDTELNAQIARDTPYGDSGTPRSLDWTTDQHLDSGWVSARVPAHFTLRKSETRRERLTVHRSGTAPAVVNGLGADIRRLWLADQKGQIYSAETIPAGGEVELKPVEGKEGKAVGPTNALQQVFQRDWLGYFKNMTDKPHEYLRPGCYLAELDGQPFIEPGLKNVRHRTDHGLVYGILKEPLP